MNREDRINYYLGEFINNRKYDENEMVDSNNLELNNDGGVFVVYDRALYNLLSKTKNLDKNFRWFRGDNNIRETKPYSLVKNRYENNNGIILRCLEFGRHWDNYYNRPKDIPFRDKINKIIWRGATTGETTDKGNRFKLVTKWYNKHENIDVGFSQIVQGKDEYNNYVKGECSITDLLKYKYILSVRGNDKDSGLQWKLNSNSVVLMTKPKVCSWLMESTLLPNYHYVLLKDDFSDLKEKLNWCNNNENKCKNIIKNAHEFMSQFKDNNLEEELENSVIEKYFEIREKN